MALKPCRECGREISADAKTCPQCGANAPTVIGPPCPKCGSRHTVRISAGAAAGVSLVGGSCLLWIPIIGWILVPFFFLAAILFGAWAVLPSGKATFNCQACKAWFTIPKTRLTDA